MDEKKEYMKSEFAFLISDGFTFLDELEINIMFRFRYKKGDLILSTSYDFRDEVIEVFLRDTNNNDVVHLLTNIFDTKIGSEEERESIKTSINNLYQDSKKYKFLMPKEHFEYIVSLYADFVKKHLEEITAWRYKS